MICHDISVILGAQNITYPGDPVFARSKPSPEAREAMCLTLGTHSGTHLDAPAHFVPDGRRLDDFPLSDFILPAQVVEIFDPEAVRVEDLEEVSVRPGEALLLRTGNSHSGRAISGEFSDRYVAISGPAAQWCVDQGLKLVGLDYISVDAYGDPETVAHRTLLGGGLLVLEGLNLADVRPGRYTLICFPLRLKDAEASPVRAVLIEGDL
jgi:arylformamidase